MHFCAYTVVVSACWSNPQHNRSYHIVHTHTVLRVCHNTYPLGWQRSPETLFCHHSAAAAAAASLPVPLCSASKHNSPASKTQPQQHQHSTQQTHKLTTPLVCSTMNAMASVVTLSALMIRSPSFSRSSSSSTTTNLPAMQVCVHGAGYDAVAVTAQEAKGSQLSCASESCCCRYYCYYTTVGT